MTKLDITCTKCYLKLSILKYVSLTKKNCRYDWSEHIQAEDFDVTCLHARTSVAAAAAAPAAAVFNLQRASSRPTRRLAGSPHPCYIYAPGTHQLRSDN